MKDYIINSVDDLNAFYETVYLLAQPEVINELKESEKEDINKMKVYNPKEPW